MRHAPFFLTGAPKSGTTWLGKLLDAHPEISCRGEACVHHFGQRLVEACKGYNELLAKRRAVITDANDFPPMPWPDVMTMMRTFIGLRFEAIADPAKPGLRFLGEKDPEHALHFKELDQLFPEAKFLHIIRDGRGVFISAWHHNVRSKDANLQRLGFDDFLDITAKEWAGRVRRARESARPLGGRYFEVRYEDLVAGPGAWTARILTFLGAAADAETVRACVEAASFENLSQGRKAGEEDKASFFRKGDPDDWKTQLTTPQIQRFNALSGGLLEELGYQA
ncbi:MAG TPA: sulfotransferase [Holophagaceae bacterium]|nr:sulfotransferase [Holophagaceae bacterium]